MITLTIKEIKDLADFAGLHVQDCGMDDDEMEAEISITVWPSECMNDDGKVERYAHIAYFSEYPEEGVFPLGEPLSVDA